MLARLFKNMARKTGLSSLFFVAAIALPLMGASVAAAAGSDKEAALIGGTRTRLAYVQTGNETLDQMSYAGLFGLGRVLYERTNADNLIVKQGKKEANANEALTAQMMPVAVDLTRDELVFFPLIYWAIDPDQSPLSKKAVKRLNDYMSHGGMLLIDTRDMSTNNRGKAWLRRAVDNGLNIPSLAKVKGCGTAKERCHVLGKSFYLLNKFPGRYAGSDLWAEQTNLYRRDGVATVLVGGNEWAAAWASDEKGTPLYPMVGDDPKQREFAYRAGINLVMYALSGNYKADQVHLPAIVQRLENKPGK